MTAQIEVVRAGALTTIQDLGRPGLAHLGIPRAGAVDRDSLKLANRLVGNSENDAGLETTVVGPRLRFAAPVTVALTGAIVDATLDEEPVAMNAPLHPAAGSVLTVGSARRGLRTYVAVRGGIRSQAAFGSRSTDIHSGIGPSPLTSGDLLDVGVTVGSYPNVDIAPVPEPAEEPQVTIVLGPRDDLFTGRALERLVNEPFRVTDDVSRVGARLDGPELERTSDEELLSEPVAGGSIQVPASGKPILLLAEHPTTGGYPVIAVVHSGDLGVAGQLRPGQRIRFRTRPGTRKRA
jgi:biotin-dependent carboxylase-like uncharacterized protein